MTHWDKVEYLIEDLAARGFKRSMIAPPFYRMLWCVGYPIRPPLFQNWLTLSALLGTVWGLSFGAAMWLIQEEWAGVSINQALLWGRFGGIFFGLSLATYFRWQAWRLKLPAWEDYPATECDVQSEA